MHRSLATATIGAFAAGWFVTAHALRGDEITDRAVIAHQRLAQLHRAIAFYLNDNEEQLDDPQRLLGYNGVIPETFWHPGDDDPMPTVIDNSIPNAPNSAQVSFLFRTGWIGELASDDYLVWDASPANNSGQFISVLMADGVIETIPPVSLSFQTNVWIAQRHLLRLRDAILRYVQDHGGQIPGSLLDLHTEQSVRWPRSFWNPGDTDPAPGDITNDVPDAINSANISFAFPAAGMLLDDLAMDAIVLQDNSPANNLGLGVNALRREDFGPHGARVELVLAVPPGDSNADGRLDLSDWARFQQCVTGWSNLIDDDSCRIFDYNQNSRIENADGEAFLQSITGPFVTDVYDTFRRNGVR